LRRKQKGRWKEEEIGGGEVDNTATDATGIADIT
jgi:hypothetical protein